MRLKKAKFKVDDSTLTIRHLHASSVELDVCSVFIELSYYCCCC